MSKPKPCHPHPDDHTRRLQGHRHTGPHADCQPCDQDHCTLCAWRHIDDQHPHVCPTCVGGLRDDLAAITRLHDALPDEATHHPRDTAPGSKRLVPMGGDAMTLAIGRHFRPTERARVAGAALGEHAEDLLESDPIPPLLVLAEWEDDWRHHLATPTDDRATVAGACEYLDAQLTLMAQRRDDIADLAQDLRQLRTLLEEVLDDGVRSVRGVECFECGTRLVRRYRDPKVCRHKTQARAWVELAHRYGYPEAVGEADVRAMREPCGRDGCDQGGMTDPAPGVGWECPACRHTYTPGEYVRAVRTDLLDSPDAGWTDVQLAAQAASVLAGRDIPPSTVRTWVHRGQVAVCCAWQPGARSGRRLVAWLDVAESATRAGPTKRAS